MTNDIPRNVGELSRYAMQEALDKIDRYLANAPQELRDAISVVRLVEGMPRQAPWFGVQVPTPEGDSVAVGTLLGNAFEALGDWAWWGPVKTEHSFTQRWYGPWVKGRTAYNDFLDHLTEPQAWERGQAEARLAHEDAQRYLQAVRDYRGTGR